MNNIIYDDINFFKEYANMERSKLGLQGAGEWHILQKMLPDFCNKSVVDLGCGYGWHCKYAVEHGACAVLGIDISKRMLKVAQQKNAHPLITYQCCPLEQVKLDSQSVDIILSSLTFHYIADIPVLFAQIATWLKVGGHFIFSVEHPIFTAQGSQDWLYHQDGTIACFPVDRYYEEGARETQFLGHKILKYHHTLTTYLNSLLQAGFSIQQVIEPTPPEEMLHLPGIRDEFRRPMMLLVGAIKL